MQRHDNEDGYSFDLIKFLKQLSKNLMTAAESERDAAKRLEGGYQTRLRDMIAAAYGLAAALHEDDQALAAFIEQPFFTRENQHRPRTGNHVGEVLMVANRFIFSATSPQLRDRCGKYAAALRPFLEEEIEASAIPVIIEEGGGIDKLYAKAKKRKETGREVGTDDDDVDENIEDRDSETEQDDAEAPDDEAEPPEAEGDPKPRRREKPSAERVTGHPTIKGTEDLRIGVTRSRLDLALETHLGDRIKIIAENIGKGPDGWVRFKANRLVLLKDKKTGS